jgi:hypothetical protein
MILSVQSNYILLYDSKKDNNNRPIVSVNIMGGLGNQMFQLATGYAYARKYDGHLQLPKNKKEYDGRDLYWNSTCSRFSRYLTDTIPSTLQMWKEKEATKYTEIPPLSENGIYLNGYLQSSKYFYNDVIKNEIKELFKPTDAVLATISAKYNLLLSNTNRVIVVHARRTDYLRNQDIINFHGPLTPEYYKEAIKKMIQKVNNPIFLLCSDDNSFWDTIISDIPELFEGNYIILNNESDVNTLALLQQFQYFIIANSTFSWWASWLAKEVKSIIAPSKWFGPTGPQDYKDIYEDNWEVI